MDGYFINYIDKELLEATIGKICDLENTAFIYGMLLGMKLEEFHPIKLLIPIIYARSGQKELLNVFIESLYDRFQLNTNWRVLLIPIESYEENIYYYVNLQARYRDLRFINTCFTKGIKLLDRSMLIHPSRIQKSISPIHLTAEDQLINYSKKLIKLWFKQLNRETFLSVLRTSLEIFDKFYKKNHQISLNTIFKTTIALLIFLIFETHDYYGTLDITEKINPYHILTRKSSRNGESLRRRELRAFTSVIFSKLLNMDRKVSKSKLSKVEIIQKYLIELLKNMRLDNLIKYLNHEVFQKIEAK